MSAVLAIAGADAAERTRRFSFIITIAAALYAGYLYVPQASAAYHTVVINHHTGIFNSAFYGATIAALTGGFLTLFGFFLVRGAVERDVDCHVDGIVGASPVRRSTFVMSKWLSSAAVLWAIGALSYLAAIVMQVLRGNVLQFDLFAYLIPFLLITVPAMAFVAAIATAFDVIPFLRSTLGNVLFVMLWPVLLAIPLQGKATLQVFDPLGLTTLTSNLVAAEQHAFPSHEAPQVNFGVLVTKHLGAPFLFPGFTWTTAIIEQRVLWLGIAVALVVLASALFDRFRRENVRARRNAFVDLCRLLPDVPALRLFRCEFGLVANGASLWWYFGAAAIVTAGALVPFGTVLTFVLPLAFIWPLERIASLGSRERRYGVEDIVSSTPGFAAKTLLCQWAAGALLGLLLCSTAVLRLAIAVHPGSLVASIAVVASIAALALALGTVTGNSRLFETLFLIAWYLGPIQHVSAIDFAAGLLNAPGVTSAVCAVLAAAGLTVARLRRQNLSLSQ